MLSQLLTSRSPVASSKKLGLSSSSSNTSSLPTLTYSSPELSSDEDKSSSSDDPSSSECADSDSESAFDSFDGTKMQRMLEPLDRRPSAVAHVNSLVPTLAHRPEPLSSGTHGTVLVVGVGYVGTHLAELFSKQYDTLAFDVSPQRCASLRDQYRDNENITVIDDLDSDERTKTFDLALISVPTLLLADNTVDTTHIVKAVEMVAKRARPGCTVVVESSVTVGMTRKLLARLRSEYGVFVGFSPERVDPGRTEPAFEDIPKIVSGIDEPSLARIAELYQRVFTTVVPVASMETAEMTKLYENCQRLVLIAYVNEISDACAKHGINVFDVCAASATKPFGFSPFTPSLGAGGHCIPVNPSYLLANCQLPLLAHAAEANRQRPRQKAVDIAAMAKKGSALRARVLGNACSSQPRVLIAGMGFKKGEASLAYAPSVALAEALQQLDVHVSYVDDFVRSDRWVRVEREALAEQHDASLALSHIDCNFDVIVVAQTPEPAERRLYESLTLAKVVYFTK